MPVIPFPEVPPPPLEPAERDAIFARLLEAYDSEIGLWREPGPGKSAQTSACPVVHQSRVAARQLMAIGSLGLLSRVDTRKCFSALRQMQVRDRSEKHGGIKWYWEEDHMEDANGAFFAAT
ncbi:unnamed protein product, partial [marine sediment metagenome]